MEKQFLSALGATAAELSIAGSAEFMEMLVKVARDKKPLDAKELQKFLAKLMYQAGVSTAKNMAT